MPNNYGREKYYSAVRTLAAESNMLRNRIEDAWRHNVMHLHEPNFPSSALWYRHEALQGKLKQEFSAVSEERGQISKDALRSLANEFVNIFSAVCWEQK